MLPDDDSNDEAKEALLYIKSEHKQAGDKSIMTRKQQQFEQDLQKLHQGLSKKYCTKRVDKVHQRIGRLKQKYPQVTKHYTLEVSEDEQGVNATALTWTYSSQHQKADESSRQLRAAHFPHRLER